MVDHAGDPPAVALRKFLHAALACELHGYDEAEAINENTRGQEPSGEFSEY